MARSFSREFELKAVRSVWERGVTVAQAVRDLGIHDNVLRRFIAEHRGIWLVTWICGVLDVSPIGFYSWHETANR